MSLNRVTVMGRLVKTPELKRTQSGTPVTAFTLAVDDDFKDGRSGERKTQFLDVVAWRQTAEFVCNYLEKGRMAVVDGRLNARTWEDNEGNRRKVVEIVAGNVYFGDSRRGEGNNTTPAQNAAETPQMAFTEVEGDGDLPF